MAAQDGIGAQVSRQAERAIAEADVVLLVVDATVGVTDEDDRVAGLLRRSQRPALVVANKVDDSGREADAWAFASLGLGDPFLVSALHGRQTGDLLDAVDQRLAERVDAAGSPIVIVLNKWETLDAERRAEVMADVGRRLEFLGYAPVLKISALTGKGVHTLVPALGQAIDAYHRRVPTGELNQVLQAAQAAHPAPGGVRVLYATQGAAEPPTFTLFATRTLPAPYVRYLERRIREHFGFGPTPLKLRVRRRT